MRILVTAFEPFGGESENPTMQIVENLQDVETQLLPVSFKEAPRIAIEKICEISPDVVILLGQAGGRTAISLERVAINIMEAKNPDNEGFKPEGVLIEYDGPPAYFCRLGLHSVRDDVAKSGIPCQISNSAGTYVCNALYYSVMHRFPKLPVLFVHVPYSVAQASKKIPVPPSMNLSDMIKAMELIIHAVVAPIEGL